MSSTNFIPMYLNVDLFIFCSGLWPFQQRNSSLVLGNFSGTFFFFFFLSPHLPSVKSSCQYSSVWTRKGSGDKDFYFSCRIKIEQFFFAYTLPIPPIVSNSCIVSTYYKAILYYNPSLLTNVGSSSNYMVSLYQYLYMTL